MGEAATMAITDEDRKRWPHMPDTTVQAHKWVHSQPGARLRAAITYLPNGTVDWSNQTLVEINREADASINWTVGTIGEALYDKHLIDETELDRIMD